MNEYIRTGDELYQYFYDEYRCLSHREDKRIESMSKGVFVSGAIRKQCLIDERQGRYTQDGKFFTIEFSNEGGGVYRAYVDLIPAVVPKAPSTAESLLDLSKVMADSGW